MLYIIEKESNTLKFTLETENKKKWEDHPDYEVLEGSVGMNYDREARKLIPKPVVESLPIPEPLKIADYNGFLSSVRGGKTWKKLKKLGTKSTRLNMAVTMLSMAVVSQSTAGMVEAFDDLRDAMIASNKTDDFSKEELAEINGALAYFNIHIVLEPKNKDNITVSTDDVDDTEVEVS